MRRFKVILSPTVQKQITEQVMLFAQDSIDNALAWEQRLRDAIMSLSDGRGHTRDPEASRRVGFSVRRLVFDRTYLVHHVVDSKQGVIRVVNFRHGARMPRKGEP